MLELNQQQLGALRGNVPPVVTTGTTGAQPNVSFSCTPSDAGCIPTPTPQSSNPMSFMNRPQTAPVLPQQGMQQAPATGTQQFAPGFQQQIPITTLAPGALDVQYLNQFLATQIGRYVTVDFLIGTSSFIDRSGILLAVGTNYILLQEANTDDILACDFYNIKFVRFYY